MNKTQWIELLHNIRKNKVAFIAIFIFVAFGVAIYTGFEWGGAALTNSVYGEIERQDTYDIEVLFPYGFDDDEIAQISVLDDVDKAEGCYFSYQTFKLNGRICQAKVVMITKDLSRLTKTEGTLPTKPGEIAVQKNWAEKNGIKIGSEIEFDKDDDGTAYIIQAALQKDIGLLKKEKTSGMKYLTENRFTVTALVESPAYISSLAAGYESSPYNGAHMSCIFFAAEESFDKNSYSGYPALFIYNNALHTDGADYATDVSELKKKLLPELKKVASEKNEKIQNAVEPYSHFVPELSELLTTEQTCAVVTRENNPSLSMFGVIADMFSVLKYNMAIPFLIIGLLVTFSTISRTVFKDSRVIGSQKALGMSGVKIISVYVMFSVLASTLGCIVGLLLSRFVIEPIFVSVLSSVFLFSTPVYEFSWTLAVLLAAGEIVFTVLATLMAGVSTVKRDALSLLNGEDAAYLRTSRIEKTGAWKRLSLLSKSIIRNCINDRRRVAATLIGVTGCTALVVCAISFSNNITGSFDMQYSTLQQYTQMVYFDPETEGAYEETDKLLTEKGILHTPVYSTTVRLIASTGKSAITSVLVSDRDFDGMLLFRTLDGKEYMPRDGAWISCAFAMHYGIDKGGEITWINAASEEVTFPCEGVYEFYMQSPRVAISKDCYEKTLGVAPAVNAFMIHTDNTDNSELQKALASVNGFVSFYDNYGSMSNAFGLIMSIATAISGVYLVLSVLMAFFMLLDLFIMFVEEKKRELITLMINGYPVSYAKKYIYSDTILLTVIGIVVGVVIGVVLAYWNVNAMTSDLSYYLHGINWLACVIGVVTCGALTFIMTMIALHRIEKFEFKDIQDS